MKICNKCGKQYDDSWDVCLGCNEKLSVMEMTEEQKEQITEIEEGQKLDSESIEELKEKRPKFIRNVLIGLSAGIFSRIFLFLAENIGGGSSSPAAINFIMGVMGFVLTIVSLVFFIIILVGLYKICTLMGASTSTIVLGIIFSFILLGYIPSILLIFASKKAIDTGRKQDSFF